MLDSARFRSILGRHLGISPKSVHANVIGEHGDSEVLVWSSAVAGTTCVERLAGQIGKDLDKVVKGSIDNEVRNSAYTIIKGKGSTYFGIASATQYICNSIISDKHAILTVSSHHDEGIGGYDNICYSLPSIVSKNGVETALVPELCDGEREALEKSAATLSEYQKSAGHAVKRRNSPAHRGCFPKNVSIAPKRKRPFTGRFLYMICRFRQFSDWAVASFPRSPQTTRLSLVQRRQRRIIFIP